MPAHVRDAIEAAAEAEYRTISGLILSRIIPTLDIPAPASGNAASETSDAQHLRNEAQGHADG